MFNLLKQPSSKILLATLLLSFSALGANLPPTCKDLAVAATGTQGTLGMSQLSLPEFNLFLEKTLKQNEINRILGKPEVGAVDKILVSKAKRELYLIKENIILKTYRIALGANPEGPKHFEGDGKTPEGLYSVDYKNAESNYHLSLHLSYPNRADLAYAKSIGLSPGANIMIHGFPNDPIKSAAVEKYHPENWTNGCLALTNGEVEEIFALVRENTLIEICASNSK